MKQKIVALLFICAFLFNTSTPINGALNEQKETKKKNDSSIVFLPGKKLREEKLFLHDAIKMGDIAKVREALRWSPKQLFKLDKNENTALHIAAAEGFYGITLCLLDLYQSNENLYELGLEALVTKNKDQKTPEQLADEKGNESIRLTLEFTQKFFRNKLAQKQEASQKRNKKPQNHQTKTGNIIKSVFFTHPIKESVDEENEKASVNLLSTVLEGDCYEVEQAVKRNRKCLYQLDRKGNSALHLAAANGAPDMIAYLLSEYKKSWWFNGYFFIAKKNKKGQTAADIALSKNCRKIYAQLIQASKFY